MATRNRQLFDRNGESVILASEIGKGGEGAVYEIQNNGNAVAKVYYSPVSKERSTKLAKMAESRTERLLKLAAWPIDTLRSEPDGPIVGFVMERIRDHKGIHFLYSPKSRLVEFPEARWPFLIHTATNLARAFGSIHEHGHVIGDVNHGNVLVSHEATVKLIDCDSFQISVDGHHFLCEVGVSTHTPPELQGLALKEITRNSNHDNFGLAVLIFQLLFMGRHPFSGEFSGNGEMSLERAISEYRFAYGKDTHLRLMKQPPGTLDLDAVPPKVGQLFQRAFLQEPDRPGPLEWITALGELSQNLRYCFYNRNHAFYKKVATCPWCEIGVESGALLFNPPWNPTAPSVAGLNLPVLWKEVETLALPEPKALPIQPAMPSLLTTSDERVRNWRRKIYTLVSASGGVLFISAVLALTATPIDISLGIILMSGTLGIMFIHKATGDMMVQLETGKDEAEARWHELKNQWFCDKERREFKELQTQLQKKKTQYQSLSRLRQEKIEKLESDLKRQHFNNYLAGVPIAEAKITNMEPEGESVLASHGIRTAGDVERNVLVALGGIGRDTAQALLDWRQSVEKRFVFDLPAGFAESGVQTIDREMTTLKMSLEREMEAGQQALRKINNDVRSRPGTLGTDIERVLLRLAQIDADSSLGVESHAPMGLLIVSIIISLIIVIASK